MAAEVTADIKEASLYLEGKALAVTDPRPILKKIVVHHASVTGKTFKAQRHGGTFRGVTWQPFADQYTRKTDGVTVPAHGGVPRADGKGLVKGRLRPSGQRLDARSNLLQDTGRLRASSARRIRLNKREVRFGASVSYAQSQQRLRKFLFWEVPKDIRTAQRITITHINRSGVARRP